MTCKDILIVYIFEYFDLELLFLGNDNYFFFCKLYLLESPLCRTYFNLLNIEQVKIVVSFKYKMS